MRKLRNWTNERLPIIEAWDKHFAKYYAPKNFNVWYFFGVFSLFLLVNQLVTGIWLAMNYEGSTTGAFASIEYIMRDVELGWLLRYLHSTGASLFFLVVYLHMFRAMLYGSYRKPRELVWLIGMVIYVLLIAEGFLGYVLPWGQMSYWGAQVIVSLFGAIPLVGETLVEWVRGDYLISGITLNRYFALHVVAIPLLMVGMVVLHILALHEVGSNNPDGIEIKKKKNAKGVPLDGIPFHPYYTVHDLYGLSWFLLVFMGIVFFAPEFGGYFLEAANFERANPLETPEHIVPVWYYTPFYAMLRATTLSLLGLDAKFWGALVMVAAIALLFLLPWLDRSPVKSIRYKGWISRVMLAVFVVTFITLGYLGLSPASGHFLGLEWCWQSSTATVCVLENTDVAQYCTFVYFGVLLLMPWYTQFERTSEPPKRVRF
jgi:ubiquinol-cytochrome c reductase cytochrome b subunit